jgi:hypothetical protein
LRIELRDERIVYHIAHRREWRRAGREAEKAAKPLKRVSLFSYHCAIAKNLTNKKVDTSVGVRPLSGRCPGDC